MSEANNTTKKNKKQYHHLNREKRIKIETLVSIKDENGKRVYSNSDIARIIGVNRSTVGRELKNRIKSKLYIRTGKIINKPYNARDAQDDYNFKRSMSKDQCKLDKHPKMKKYIEDKIKNEGWMPDAIIGYMEKHNIFKREGFCKITTQALYYDIRHKLINIGIKDMRRMKYDYKYDYKGETNDLPESKKNYSIERRPEEVDKRLTFGHFELDTVIGTNKGVHECIMTLTERKTRFEMIFKLKSKSADEVVEKFNQIKDFMKSNFNKIFKSLSTDNGTEFSKFLEIISDTKTQIYFCHPYCSGEKGTNERNNEIIRYFIPKGSLLENYSFDDINKIADWMNNYPRKSLNYQTPLEALLDEFSDKSVINKIYKLQEKVNC